MIWIILDFLCYMFVFSYIVIDIIGSIKNKKYQKKWDEEKTMLIKVDPMITRAELCEQYVMFRIRNNCDVEF